MKLNITENGVDIILHCLDGGDSPVFTRIGIGNGSNAGISANALTHEIVTASITACSRVAGSSYVELTTTFSNGSIDERFRANETGVFVQDPDNSGQELMFAYGYTDDEEAAVIPAVSDYAFETSDTYLVYIGNIGDVSAIITGSLETVSKAEFNAHTGNRSNPHGVTKSQIGLGNVENVKFKDMTIEFDSDTVLSQLNPSSGNVTGDNVKTLFGKIGQAVKSLIAHLDNKNNPHGVSVTQIGAAKKTHSHSATEISSGVLPVERGGTGVNTAQNLTALFSSSMHVPVFGSYKGDGTAKRHISLGFTPTAVFVIRDNGAVENVFMYGSSYQYTFGGLFFASKNLVVSNATDSRAYTSWISGSTCGMIGKNGSAEGFFIGTNYSTTNGSTTQLVRTNVTNENYYYIAWK